MKDNFFKDKGKRITGARSGGGHVTGSRSGSGERSDRGERSERGDRSSDSRRDGESRPSRNDSGRDDSRRDSSRRDDHPQRSEGGRFEGRSSEARSSGGKGAEYRNGGEYRGGRSEYRRDEPRREDSRRDGGRGDFRRSDDRRERTSSDRTYNDRPQRSERSGREYRGGERKDFRRDDPRRDDRPARSEYRRDEPRRDESRRDERQNRDFGEKRDFEKKSYDKPYNKKPYEKKGYDKKSFDKKGDKFGRESFPDGTPNWKELRKKESPESYLIYGRHPAMLALKNPRRKIAKVYCTENLYNVILKEFGPEKFESFNVSKVTPDKLEDITKTAGKDTNHQGIAVEVKKLVQPEFSKFLDSKLIVLLDKISDPHNIGAIIRSAAAFGADCVITQEKGSPEENATIGKTSAGCIEIMPYLRLENMPERVEELKANGFKIAALDGAGATKLTELKAHEKLVLVVGSEGAGVNRNMMEQCDFICNIPISDKVESLNASVAAAVAIMTIKG